MRPRTLYERLTVTADPGLSQTAAMSNMLLHLAFLLGQCVGQYATATCHLTMHKAPGTQILRLTAEIAVPLEELGD